MQPHERESLFHHVADRLFPHLERLDNWLHGRRWPNPVCAIVGAMEVGYYDRGTDWAHPLFVKAESPTWTPESRRIANKRLLDAVLAVWDGVPDQRFGQFVMNLSREPGGFADTWEWSHSDWHRQLEEAAKTWAT